MTETATSLSWDASGSEEAAVENRVTARQIGRMVREGDGRKALAAVRRWPVADIVALLMSLRSKDARRLIEIMPDETGLGVLSEIDPHLHALLAEEETKAKFRKLLRKLDQDRAIRLLDEMPRPYALDLIEGHPHAAELREALETNDDLASAHMRRGILTAREDGTIGEIIADIRARSEEIDRLERVYVVDHARHLKGSVRLRDLILYDDDTPVVQVMQPPRFFVTAETDQEDVLALATKYNIQNLAVVDGEGRLLGGIAAQELREISSEEAKEDMLLMGGVSPEASEFDGPVRIVRSRLPWILLGLIGSGLSASVIGSFETALTEAAILASFIPVVMGTAGNVGVQASTMSIQAIGSGVEWSGDFLPRLGRELLGAAINGVVVGAVVGLLVLFIGPSIGVERAQHLALTCAAALLIVTMVAGSYGALVPFILKKLKLDPAVATGIFINTANDVFGVLIFFTVASLIYF
ncbi:magnesium transporter [Tropicimonas isoalkanivorans]|uniref:Magnesium transporter MgtE n=1 Tax=Tropicimonas isoalkanivorans TaxID=441112 RepID=A0A1I1FU94_9RHOB|nr:magnesium transporter [Tropicimonas isoalkanivorans]SFC02894.1 magnesium transporter [Tropicimonas isoalkanivorans]